MKHDSHTSSSAKEPLFADAACRGGDVALRFVLASDTHVMPLPAWMDSRGRFCDMIDLAYAYADACPNPRLDAFLVVGDLVDNGRRAEYEEYVALVKEKARPETPWITVIGNHEYFEGSEKEYREYICPETAVHTVIGGYHFIGVSCEDGYGNFHGHMSFLREAVEEALADDPDKPVFTFQHYPIGGTVYLSRYEGAKPRDDFLAVYARSPRIVNFSGHSHGAVNHPRAIWQREFTAFANGTLTYFCHEKRMAVNYYDPWMIEEANQFCMVEVLADHTVRIIPMDVHSKDVFRVPINSAPLFYEFNVSHPDSWPYTEEKRALVPPPHFKAEAAVAVKREGGEVASITFPQADAEGGIEGYHIVLKGNDGSQNAVDYSSAYFLKPMPEEITVSLSEITSKGVSYTVAVEPFDALGKRGEPLTAILTV